MLQDMMRKLMGVGSGVVREGEELARNVLMGGVSGGAGQALRGGQLNDKLKQIGGAGAMTNPMTTRLQQLEQTPRQYMPFLRPMPPMHQGAGMQPFGRSYEDEQTAATSLQPAYNNPQTSYNGGFIQGSNATGQFPSQRRLRDYLQVR